MVQLGESCLAHTKPWVPCLVSLSDKMENCFSSVSQEGTCKYGRDLPLFCLSLTCNPG